MTEETWRNREVPLKFGELCIECGRIPGREHKDNCSNHPSFVQSSKICACGATTPTSHAHWCPNVHGSLGYAGDPPPELCGYAGDPIPQREVNTEPYGFPKKTAPKEKSNKPDWAIFPFSEAEEVLKAFTFGAKKYGAPFTYRIGTGVPEDDLLSAVIRHLTAIQNGEDIAPDSQCLHWSHVACNALMAITTYQIKQRQTLT